MKLDELLQDCYLINDDTDITLAKGSWSTRGKWFNDNILVHSEDEVEYYGMHVTFNSATIVLK